MWHVWIMADVSPGMMRESDAHIELPRKQYVKSMLVSRWSNVVDGGQRETNID